MDESVSLNVSRGNAIHESFFGSLRVRRGIPFSRTSQAPLTYTYFSAHQSANQKCGRKGEQQKCGNHYGRTSDGTSHNYLKYA